MKKKHLRNEIKKVLNYVNWGIIIFFAMLSDFTVNAIPILLALVGIVIINEYLLHKFD